MDGPDDAVGADPLDVFVPAHPIVNGGWFDDAVGADPPQLNPPNPPTFDDAVGADPPNVFDDAVGTGPLNGFDDATSVLRESSRTCLISRRMLDAMSGGTSSAKRMCIAVVNGSNGTWPECG